MADGPGPPPDPGPGGPGGGTVPVGGNSPIGDELLPFFVSLVLYLFLKNLKWLKFNFQKLADLLKPIA